MASGRKPLDWFAYQVGMHSFRAFAQGKATWILNYSWDGDKNVDIKESMKNLAMSQIMAGANFWDAPGHSMGGSNDLPTRKEIFSWIKAHEKTFYLPRSPIHPIGVYFSPTTRNYNAEAFISSYRGILILLMQKHLEFQIVTPRTLGDFKGETLVLPNVGFLDASEKNWLRKFAEGGKSLIVTGKDATELGNLSSVSRFENCPGAAYMEALEKNFEGTSPDSQSAFLQKLKVDDGLSISASPLVATSVARVDGNNYVYLANFAGLKGGVNPVQTPQTDVRIKLAATGKGKAYFLPFMGDKQEIKGERSSGHVSYLLPPVAKGGVFWYQASSKP
jgi:hypothetical protein